MNTIRDCIQHELEWFDQEFCQTLHTRVPLADNVIRYFLDKRGKQMRPVMTLLAAKVVSGRVSEATIRGAVALELLHNASLMHDDVVDQSGERRGIPSINKVWDNKVAVLMGDFFLSKCLSSSNATGSLDISNILADMVSRLAEGELEQLSNMRSRLMSEAAYFSVISDKTASLFAACLKVGAYSVGAKADDIARMAQVGELMGLIFQIRDDIFDYYPTSSEVGKPTGHDIMEGKVTLPLLYALDHAPEDEAKKMKGILESTQELSSVQVSLLVEFAKNLGGIEYAQAKMKNLAYEAKKLLLEFPESEAREAMINLIGYFVERNG